MSNTLPFCEQVPGGDELCRTMADFRDISREMTDQAITDVIGGTTDPNPLGLASLAAAMGDQTLEVTARADDDVAEFTAMAPRCPTCPLADVCERPEA